MYLKGWALALVAVLLTALSVRAQSEVFRAHLSGGSVVPSVPATGSGNVVATLNGDTLSFAGGASGLVDVLVVVRLKQGYAGQNGTTLLDLDVAIPVDGEGSFSFLEEFASYVLTQAQIVALKDRRLYVEVESPTYPNGEVRGQLLPDAERYFEAVMDGGEAVPSALTEGYGSIVVELTDSVATISGSFSNLTTPARVDFLNGTHIHFTRFADSGNNIRYVLNVEYDADLKGGIIRADSNQFKLGDWQHGLLLDRQWYVDVHSLKWRLQELRGVVLPMSDLYFVGRMTGHNVVPPNESGASVGILGELLGDTLTLSGTFLPLDGDVDTLGPSPAHVHNAFAGDVGNIEFPLKVTLQRQNHGHFLPLRNRFVLTEEQIETLLAGGFYADVHSSARPESGEVRGQILLKANNPTPPAMLTSPVVDARVDVATEDPEPLAARWQPTEDPDGDKVVYVWQLGQNQQMSSDSLIFSVSTGTDTEYLLPGHVLDSLLVKIGVEFGETRELYQRLVTSDGAANHRGSGRRFLVRRGEISSLPEGTPQSVDIDPEVVDRLNSDIQNGEFSEVHGIVLVRDGRVIHESYYPGNTDYFGEDLELVSTGDTAWTAEMPHYLAGVTATVTSALIGAALDTYDLSPQRKIESVLPDYSDRITGRELEISIQDLVTMTSGYEWRTEDPSDLELMWQTSDDFVAYALDRTSVDFPGQVWTFNPGAVNILMGIIDHLSGDVDAFIKQRLFDPLDIDEFNWMAQPSGLPEASMGLWMKPRDLAKLAYLYLRAGVWNEGQLIPEDWVASSLQPRFSARPSFDSDFGYLWWVREIEYQQDGVNRRQQYFAAEGDGGNLVAVFPRLDLAVVITQGNYGQPELYRSQIERILVEYLLPGTDARNHAPIIQIDTPRDGAQPGTATPFEISGSAVDPDGKIVRVDVLQGSFLLQSDTATTFSLTIDSTFSGCYTINVRATDDFGDVGMARSRIKMGEGCVPGPYAMTPFVVPGIIEAEDYDVGGPDISYLDRDRGVNRGGAYRANEGVDLASRNDTIFVTATEDGEWIQYFFEASEADEYDFIARTSGEHNGRMSVEIDSLIVVEPVDIVVSNEVHFWTDTRLARVTLDRGFHRIRVNIERGGFDFDHLRVGRSAVTTALTDDHSLPTEFGVALYPSIVSKAATVSLALPSGERVAAELFDAIGRHVSDVFDGRLAAGTHRIPLSPSNFAAGVYFLRVVAGDRQVVKKLVLVR